MSPRLISSKSSPSVVGTGEARLGHAPPALLLEIGAVEVDDLVEVGEVEQPVDGVDLVVARAEASLDAPQHLVGHRVGDLDADRATEPPSLQLQLDRFQQVVGFVGELEVGVSRDAERRAFGDLHLREERRQRVRDHVLEREEELPLADADEARQELGHLDAGESLFARLRIPDEHAERERQRRDVRERLTRPDGERRQHGIDLPVEERRQLVELLLGAVRDPADQDPFLLERGAQLALPEARLLGRQREHSLADLGQRLLRRASVQRVNREARRLLAHEATDAHREELVEVLGEPRAERQALEERETWVGGELEDALVEVERGQLAVEEPLRPLDGGFLLVHGRH